MDTRKVTLVATIAVIALLAVGIGYAYTAMTTNQGNNASPEHLSIVQGGTGEYQFAPGNQHIYWDSNDFKVLEGNTLIGEGGIALGDFVTVFTMTGTTSTTDVPITDTESVQIGNSFTLTVTPTGYTVSGQIDAKVTASNFFIQAAGAVGSADIFMVADDGTAKQYFKLDANNHFMKGTISTGVFTPVADEASNVLEFPMKDASSYKTLTMSIYYVGSTGGYVVEHDSGVAPVGPSSKPIENGTLIFRINQEGANGADSNNHLTGMTLSKYAMDLTYGGSTDTATISFTETGTAPAAGKVVSPSYKDGDETIATAAIVGTTITVTPLKAGSTVITFTTAEGSFTQSISVNVAKKTVSDLTATFDPAAPAHGAEVNPPSVTIKDNETTLTVSTDYTGVWTNSTGAVITKLTEAGTYHYVLTGAGNYDGQKIFNLVVS